MNTVTKKMKEIYQEKPIYLLLVLLVVLSIAFVPQFGSQRNLIVTLIQASDLIIMSCGLTFVILNGGIDFSIVAIMSLVSVVGASIMTRDNGYMGDSPFGFFVAIIVMLFIGMLIGALNGLSVVKLRMPSFMASMAVNLIFGGFALFYTTSDSITNLPKEFMFIADGSILHIPFPIILTAIVVISTHYLLSRTVFGKSIFAVGTNQKTSFISGLKVKEIIFKLFVINGFIAALAGVLVTARIGAGKPNLGNNIFIDVVTAVIIGGTSIFGGAGSILGAVAGALFISVLNVSLSLLGVQWYVILIVKGLILMIVALVDAFRRSN